MNFREKFFQKSVQITSDFQIFTILDGFLELCLYFDCINYKIIMTYRRPQVRSPPRNYKVNFTEEPPLEVSQKTFITNLVPKIGRNATTPEQIQIELSNQLCRYLKKSVGVSVVENKEGVTADLSKKFPGTTAISFTMNEFSFRIWIHQSKVLEEDPFGEKRETKQ